MYCRWDFTLLSVHSFRNFGLIYVTLRYQEQSQAYFTSIWWSPFHIQSNVWICPRIQWIRFYVYKHALSVRFFSNKQYDLSTICLPLFLQIYQHYNCYQSWYSWLEKNWRCVLKFNRKEIYFKLQLWNHSNIVKDKI